MDILETGLLSLIVFLPLLGTVILMLIPAFPFPQAAQKTMSRWIALGFSVVVFLLTLYLFVNYDQAAGGFQFEERSPWFALLGSEWHVGVDGMVLLTGLLVPLAILISFEVEDQVPAHLALFLLLRLFVSSAENHLLNPLLLKELSKFSIE